MQWTGDIRGKDTLQDRAVLDIDRRDRHLHREKFQHGALSDRPASEKAGNTKYDCVLT